MRINRGRTFLLSILGLSMWVLPVAAQGQKTLTPEDWGKWERLGGATLSADGRWLATAITRVNEENELRIRQIANPDSVIVVAYGRAPNFSADGRWLAYAIGLGEEEREKLEKEKKPVHDALGMVDLRTGEDTRIEDVASYAFSADGGFLAMRRYPPKGEREAAGVDLVVRDLSAGRDINFGNVGEYAWQDDEDDIARLAMIIDAENRAGNGLQLYEPGSGRLRVLDAAEATYSGLTWREEAPDLALFRTVDGETAGEEAWADTANAILAFRGLGDAAATPAVFEPASAGGFPSAHRVVDWQELRWSDDGARLFFGIQERTAADPCDSDSEDEDSPESEDTGNGDAADEDDPDDEEAEDADACDDEDEDITSVEIWHAADVDIVPTQKVRADRDRRDNYLSVWHTEDDRFVQIESELTESVRLIDDGSGAVGLDQTPYEDERMFGPVYNDLHLIDLETGEREKAVDRVQYFVGQSPGGRYLLWFTDDQYWTHDIETGQTVNITAGLGTSFVDVEDDHPVDQKPPFGTAGWLEGDAAVLINDEHDVWRVAPDGSGGERLTRGAENNLRHRRARTDREFDSAPIDPSEPMYFSVYDDWLEEWGYARADQLGARVQTLIQGEARFSSLLKAEDAETYLYRMESFEDSPDYFVSGNAALEGAQQITRTNPFQGEYAWGRSELIEFENAWGDQLQGSLYYPANYEPGKQYPMIVYIYEIRSPQVRSYPIPSERTYYNIQGWVHDGYFVWQPDIVYRDRDPGVSAVAAIEPSIAKVIETGMVDPDGVGLIGHSWGGYQTTFAVTQTDIFSAAVAGAPLTNLFSMYLSVYWNSGGTDARIFEISQGRMEVPFWEDEDAYKRNSPVFHIENMNTPLLMAQGTEDGAVDFNQGVEFYNAARRAGKDFVFIVYNDENHGFRKKENQLDYHRRIMEWFGHYLKGEPAPDWIREGVPYLDQPGGQKKSGDR